MAAPWRWRGDLLPRGARRQRAVGLLFFAPRFALCSLVSVRGAAWVSLPLPRRRSAKARSLGFRGRSATAAARRSSVDPRLSVWAITSKTIDRRFAVLASASRFSSNLVEEPPARDPGPADDADFDDAVRRVGAYEGTAAHVREHRAEAPVSALRDAVVLRSSFFAPVSRASRMRRSASSLPVTRRPPSPRRSRPTYRQPHAPSRASPIHRRSRFLALHHLLFRLSPFAVLFFAIPRGYPRAFEQSKQAGARRGSRELGEARRPHVA